MENTDDKETIAERPRRERLRPTSEDKHLQLRNILNIIFMIAAIVGVLLYVYSPAALFGVSLGGIIIGFAIVVKAVEVVVRMLK